MRASVSIRPKWRSLSICRFAPNRSRPGGKRLSVNTLLFLSVAIFAACRRVEPSFAEARAHHENVAQTAQPSQAETPRPDEKGVRLPGVRLEGTYFSREGRRFLPAGAHWVPARAGLAWPIEWNPKEIEADFVKMRELGFNSVRFDLFWAWFEPRPGDYNPEAFRQLDYLICLAHRYQIYLHPTLFIGGEVGEAFWDVPWRHGRHPHADPEMLRLQADHAAELGRHYRNESAILAWDLTDEPPYWIVAGRIYRALLEWAGVRPLFRTNHPSVEIGAIKGDGRGYAILANHGPRTLPVMVETDLPLRSLLQVTDTGLQALSPERRGWKMSLGPYEGAVIEWKQ